MEVQGAIRFIGDYTQVSASFQKRELVVTTDEQYPQHISITFVQDKCTILDKYRLGEIVKVGINLRGREWVKNEGETKYFNDIQGWRVEKVAEGSNIEVNDPTNIGAEEEPDVPF